MPVKIKCDLADNHRIEIKEATWLRITTTDGRVTRKTRQKVYIMERDTNTYLS